MTALLYGGSLVHLSPLAESSSQRALLVSVVESLRSREDRITERVLHELVPEVRRWMLRHLGPSQELDDAVQDALTEIARALHRFEGRSSIATLAHRIALRTSYRYYRRRPLVLSYERAAATDPVDQIDARRALARVHRCLAKMSPRRRAVIVLCGLEGMSPQEAAEVMQMSAVATRSLLCRARQQLRSMLSEVSDV